MMRERMNTHEYNGSELTDSQSLVNEDAGEYVTYNSSKEPQRVWLE
jgi:hypothetical protein